MCMRLLRILWSNANNRTDRRTMEMTRQLLLATVCFVFYTAVTLINAVPVESVVLPEHREPEIITHYIQWADSAVMVINSRGVTYKYKGARIKPWK